MPDKNKKTLSLSEAVDDIVQAGAIDVNLEETVIVEFEDKVDGIKTRLKYEWRPNMGLGELDQQNPVYSEIGDADAFLEERLKYSGLIEEEMDIVDKERGVVKGIADVGIGKRRNHLLKNVRHLQLIEEIALEKKPIEPELSYLERIRANSVYVVVAISTCVAVLCGITTLYNLIGLYKNMQNDLASMVTPTPAAVFEKTPEPLIYIEPTSIPAEEQSDLESVFAGTPEPFVYVTPAPVVIDPWIVSRVSQSSADEQFLRQGEVLYVSASHYKVGDKICENNSKPGFLCVYVRETAQDETVKIEYLIPGHVWIGVTNQLSIQDVIMDRESFWWDYSNCVSGCKEVKVIMQYADGRIEEKTYTPESRPTIESVVTGMCEGIDQYYLEGLTQLSSDDFIHVEFYTGGNPERDTLLPPGEYTLLGNLKGYVWELGPDCTAEDILTRHMEPHIQRRLNLGYNNNGYVHWTSLVDDGLVAVNRQEQPLPDIPTTIN